MARTKAGAKHEPAAESAESPETVAPATPEVVDESRSATVLFVSRFVYTTCYTISYGVVFPAALLARSVPRDNAAVRGLMDGAEAARQKVAGLQIESSAAQADGMLPSPA